MQYTFTWNELVKFVFEVHLADATQTRMKPNHQWGESMPLAAAAAAEALEHMR